MRSSSCFTRPSSKVLSTVNSIIFSAPLAMDSQASPTCICLRDLEGSSCMASRQRSDFSGKRSESVRVPGVTTRTTLRSTGPLLVAGSPICSQIATDSPSLIRRARYCSTEWKGTPAILIGLPLEEPRWVRVTPIRREAFSASSKKSS